MWNFFVTRYNTARPAVMSDVHFRNKMFPIWDVPTSWLFDPKRILLKEKDRTYYEVYTLPRNEKVPEGYKEISFVCLRPDGAYEAPSTIGVMCKRASQKVEGLEGFHFHQLRHTFTSNLLSNGAAPKDVQELLGHSDVSTTMNVYAHSTREAKRTSARLLDKVVGG